MAAAPWECAIAPAPGRKCPEIRRLGKMGSPRVLKLTYHLEWNPNGRRVADSAPAPSVFRVGDFDANLESGRWVFVPQAEFYSAEGARAALEPLLHDWETEWDLKYDLRVTFELDDCIFEQPPHVEGEPFATSGKFVTKASMTGSIIVALGQYPVPPSLNLLSSPLAAQLRARWHEIEDGRNTLLAGAYWFLTTFVTEFGRSPKAAAKSLVVDSKVLSKLGYLTSGKNDPIESRKNKGPIVPLSDNEKAWVREAVKTLMSRAVEVRSGRSGLSRITMNDLPKL
jgi:hypothetical protein